MPTNEAAWLRVVHGDLEVGPAPYTPPGADQIVVRNHAVAVNPLESVIQVAGHVAYRGLRYPIVLGSDLAGEVVEVGSAVTRFRVGDRVLAHAVGTDKDASGAAEGAFQEYTVVLERMASPIPDQMSAQDACVLPLGLSTAACALFQRDQLALRHPGPAAPRTGEVVLVWGGATSVGANAVQLAVAAGYDVVATASPHSAGLVRSLGAAHVVDYRSATAAREIVDAVGTRTLAGVLAIPPGAAAACAEVAAACPGRQRVAVASPPVPLTSLEGERHRWRRTVGALLRTGVSVSSTMLRARLRGVRMAFVFATTVKANEVGTAVYRDFLPDALAAGRYVAAPPPRVVGHGLGSVQHALEVQRAGVSAEKVVVSLTADAGTAPAEVPGAGSGQAPGGSSS